VGSQEKLPEKAVVRRDGSREVLTLTEPVASDFARLAAGEYGVAAPREVAFDDGAVKAAYEGGKWKSKK
jgi:hypothetical protein